MGNSNNFDKFKNNKCKHFLQKFEEIEENINCFKYGEVSILEHKYSKKKIILKVINIKQNIKMNSILKSWKKRLNLRNKNIIELIGIIFFLISFKNILKIKDFHLKSLKPFLIIFARYIFYLILLK